MIAGSKADLEDILLVDSRRGRLLKKLNILIMRDRMEVQMSCMLWRTWLAVGVMLVTHVVCYVVVSVLIKQQHS